MRYKQSMYRRHASVVEVDKKRVVVDRFTWTVECDDEAQCMRVGRAVQHNALKPYPLWHMR